MSSHASITQIQQLSTQACVGFSFFVCGKNYITLHLPS